MAGVAQMQSESWDLSPVEAGYVASVKALCAKCEAAASPHQKRVESELAPAKSAVTEMLKLLAQSRAVDPERVASLKWPDKPGQPLTVDVLPAAEQPPKPEEGAP